MTSKAATYGAPASTATATGGSDIRMLGHRLAAGIAAIDLLPDLLAVTRTA